MSEPKIGELLADRGVTRRALLKVCAGVASALALPTESIPAIAQALTSASRPSVVWLSFQECTGCSESLLRSDSPTLESLILETISLDYHHLLQAAAGAAAETTRDQVLARQAGKYILVVDGSVPLKDDGVYSVFGGASNRDLLGRAAHHAAAVVAVGTCAAFGGIPKAFPNPTGAVPVSALVKDKSVINVSGCPPIPIVITAVLAHYLTFGTAPELDGDGRPTAFYGETVHDRCYRRPFYDEGKFARSFDDEGARNGWCLYELGCKGPTTYNSCATLKWNGGTSFPIQSGHGCLGCSEPDFWDRSSFYKALPTGSWGDARTIAAAAAVGVAMGAAAGLTARRHQKLSQIRHPSNGDPANGSA